MLLGVLMDGRFVVMECRCRHVHGAVLWLLMGTIAAKVPAFHKPPGPPARPVPVRRSGLSGCRREPAQHRQRRDSMNWEQAKDGAAVVVIVFVMWLWMFV